jgi:hypothetical protein
MARRNRVLPTYSHKPPARHNTSTGMSRRMRRARVHHHSVYHRNRVWHPWLHIPLNELGVLLRVTRIAKRRGKSQTWISKRFNRDLRLQKGNERKQRAKLQEIYEQMQQGMLQGEHEHEHGETRGTGTDPMAVHGTDGTDDGTDGTDG